jgi:hypothetical protein
MKKLVVVMVLLFIPVLCFADRVKDLSDQQAKAMQDIQQAQQYIEQKKIEVYKLQGAIEELQRAAKPTKKDSK